MEKNLLKVIKEGFRPSASTNFSNADLQTAALNAIKEQMGLSGEVSFRDLRGKTDQLFAIIEEVLAELVPEALQADFPWAEVRTYGVNDEVIFEVKKVGSNRLHSVIQRGARGGVYRVKKLDGRLLRVETSVYTYAVEIDVVNIMCSYGGRSWVQSASVAFYPQARGADQCVARIPSECG